MRFCLTTLLAFLSLICFAQISRGTISTGGNLGFNFENNSRLKQSNFNLSITPDVHYFVSKNLCIGSHIGYSLSIQNNLQNKTKNQFQGFVLGPSLKYYIKISDKVYAFVNGKIGYQQTKEIFSSNSIFGITKGANWQLGPGLAIFLTKSASLDISMAYNGVYRSLYLANNNGAITTPVKETNHGLLFNVGFSIYFFKKMLVTPSPNTTNSL